MAGDERVAHSQRLRHVGGDDRAVLLALRQRGAAAQGRDGRLGKPLAGDGDRAEQQRADQGQQTDPGVKQEGDQNVDRCPGRVEQRDDGRAGQCAAHRVEIAQGLRALHRRAAGRAQDAQQDGGGQPPLQPHAGAQEEAHAHRVEDRIDRQRDDQDQRQQQERRHPARRHHPVIDLQHEDRRREVQEVDQPREQRRRDQMRATAAHHGHQARGG